MNHLFTLLLCLVGFLLLACAMYRSQSVLFGRELTGPVSRLFRLGGTVILFCALGWVVSWQGWGLGLVLYSGHTSISAGVVFIALITYEKLKNRA